MRGGLSIAIARDRALPAVEFKVELFPICSLRGAGLR